VVSPNYNPVTTNVVSLFLRELSPDRDIVWGPICKRLHQMTLMSGDKCISSFHETDKFFKLIGTQVILHGIANTLAFRFLSLILALTSLSNRLGSGSVR
uniref:Uncharacterized protein n=1 Tax=Peromyscus maniculatus bairdii TaxID=230844 RepID=A0A8C9CTV2_PERMB